MRWSSHRHREGWRTHRVCTGGAPGTAALLPLLGLHPRGGKDWGGGPKKTWQWGENIQLGFRAQGPPLGWGQPGPSDCQVKSGPRGRAALAH